MSTPQEKRWIIAFAAILFLVTLVPFLAGFLTAGSEWRFSGFLIAVDDGNSYIAKMLSGANGAWLFRTPYTAYPQNGVLAFLPYLLLGKLSTPVGQHTQLVILFQLFRLAGCLLMALASYDFAALFIPEVRWRRLTAVLATVGGGFGWLALAVFGLFYWIASRSRHHHPAYRMALLLLGLGTAILLGWAWARQLPLEFYSPETFGLLSFFTLPHLAAGRAFLLWGLVMYLREGPAWKAWVWGGLAWLGLGLMQPVTLVVAWAIPAAHLGLMGLIHLLDRRRGKPVDWARWRRRLGRAAGIVLVSSPLVVYTGLAYLTDPFLKTWTSQNIITSPPPWDYLLSYGLFLGLAVLAAIRIVKAREPRELLLVAWLALLPILAYAPYPLQRRLPEGSWVAMLALAVLAVRQQSAGMQKGFLRSTWPAFIPLLFLLVAGTGATLRPAPPLFIPAGEAEAILDLGERVQPGEVVLASFNTSNNLPAWAPVRTLTGHGPESAHGHQINPRVEAFFQLLGNTTELLRLLSEFQVSYVFYGPEESALAGQNNRQGEWEALPPDLAAALTPVYDRGGYRIYRVNHQALK